MNQEDTFELNGVLFVWNQEKARNNLTKHGVEFTRAAEAFFDPFVRIVESDRAKEKRHALIGMDNGWNLLFVVHIEIVDDSFRIISARRATNSERKFYEDQ